MSLTIANIITNLDSYIGDTTNNSVSAAERLQYITEATVWLQEGLQNDVQNETYELDYLDTVHTYRITASMPDLYNAVDLRLSEEDQYNSFTLKSSRELAEDIGQMATDDSYSIERHDDETYLVINHKSKYPALQLCSFESLTSDGGTWEALYDGTNISVNELDYKNGSASLEFDVAVSLHASNTTTIRNTNLNPLDILEYRTVGSFLFWLYIPEVTNFTSVSISFVDTSGGSSYLSGTVTTAIDGNSFANGWNLLKFDWVDMSEISSPDLTNIIEINITLQYTAGYNDEIGFKIDDLKVIRPEPITFHYTTWSVGTNSSGTKLYAFTATSDIPYFSGQYDQYKFAVSHKAAALVFQKWRESGAMSSENSEASKALDRAQSGIPSSVVKEDKAFKSKQISFKRRKF